MDPKMIWDPEVVGCKLHYFDSGSFTLMAKAKEFSKRTNKPEREFCSTKAAKKYLDNYIAFVKEYRQSIDLYSNVDVIGDPELTWRNQQYLEQAGLDPVPVVHCGTDLAWLDRYLENYKIVALGGLVLAAKTRSYYRWLDTAFDLVCSKTSNRTPCVKLHGFGITNYQVMIRYPWWSVDSSAWTKRAGFGLMLVPHKRNGKFTFDIEPHQFFVSIDAPSHNQSDKHYNSFSSSEKAIIHEWLNLIQVPFGQTKNGKIIEYGVSNHYSYRKANNLFFFEMMRKSLPHYPWPFQPVLKKRGFL